MGADAIRQLYHDYHGRRRISASAPAPTEQEVAIAVLTAVHTNISTRRREESR